MRRSGWTGRRGAAWRVASAFVAAAVVVSLAGGGPANADPKPEPRRADSTNLPGESHASRDRDNRVGAAVPDAKQRDMAGRLAVVRWNALGTPAALGPAQGAGRRAVRPTRRRPRGSTSTATATCSASTRRRWPRWTGCWSGRSAPVRSCCCASASATCPPATTAWSPSSSRGGTVLRVTLVAVARHPCARSRPRSTRRQAFDAALRDAGLGRRPGRAQPTSARSRCPRRPDGPRAAYAVTLISDRRRPTRPRTPRTSTPAPASVLVREDLVDFDSDNPKWAVFPATPPPRSRPARTRGCAGA